MDILLRGAAVKFLSRKNSLKFDDVLAAKKSFSFSFLLYISLMPHALPYHLSSVIIIIIALQYSIGKKELLFSIQLGRKKI